MTQYQGPAQRQRWLAIKNVDTAKQTMPGYGVGFIVGYEQIGSQLVLLVGRNAVTSTDANKYIVNGPTPLPYNAIGRGTQDYPAIALVHYASGGLPSALGPTGSQWYLTSGSVFTAISDDGTTRDKQNRKTALVAPRVARGNSYAFASLNRDAVSHGASLPLFRTLGGWPTSHVIGTNDGYHLSGFTRTSDTKITCTQGGFYAVTFSSVFNDFDAMNDGDLIGATFYINGVGNNGSPLLRCLQSVMVVQDYLNTAQRMERVTIGFSGMVRLFSDDVLEVRNDTGFMLDYQWSSLAIHLVDGV